MIPDSDFERVKRLKQLGDLAGAKNILWRLADESNAESRMDGWEIASWAYEQLAIIYRKERDRTMEKLALERLNNVAHSQGVTASSLRERIQRIERYPYGKAGCSGQDSDERQEEPAESAQLFLDFWNKVRREASSFGVNVTLADIDFYIRWGAELWLHGFDPDRARREGYEPQVAEALAKIRATLDLSASAPKPPGIETN